MARHSKRSRNKQTPVERADIDAVRAAAKYRETAVVRAAGLYGGLADQPPLTALSLGMIGVGLARGDPPVARAGFRMLAAHAIGTAVKTVLKTYVDRTRPALLVDEGRYELAKGEDSDDHRRTSFPSGHTVGAVAVARAWAREFPAHSPAVNALAGLAAVAQIPRCAHFPTDVGAGAVIGVLAEAVAAAVVGAAEHALARATRSG